jgi:hypothetical protein
MASRTTKGVAPRVIFGLILDWGFEVSKVMERVLRGRKDVGGIPLLELSAAFNGR